MGLLLFCGVAMNLPNIYALINNPAYFAGTYVFLLLGTARLYDMLTGLNGTILLTSRYYRYDLWFNLILVALAFISNYYLIAAYGMNGAALATLISIVGINTLRLGFVWKVLKLHPFSLAMLGVLALAVGAYLIQMLIPRLPYWYLDLPIRSLVFAGLFGGSVYALNLSQDVNEYAHIIGKRIRDGRGKKSKNE